jgi:hypothetical protein
MLLVWWGSSLKPKVRSREIQADLWVAPKPPRSCSLFLRSIAVV